MRLTVSLTQTEHAPAAESATEGAVHVDRDHTWHMEPIPRVVDAAADPQLVTTSYRVSCASAVLASESKPVDPRL